MEAIYIRNLAAARERFGDFENHLEQVSLGTRVEVVPATPANIYPTFYYSNGPQKILVHSKYAPLKEAYQLLDGKSFADVHMIFVLGLGFGYHLQYLLKDAHFNGDIFVIEPSWEVFKAALQNRDLTELFANKKVHLIVEPDAEKVRQIIYVGDMFKFEVYKTEFVYLPAYRQIFKEYYETVLDAVNVRFTMNSANVFCALELSGYWERNSLNNLSEFFRSAPFTLLKASLKDKAAVLVGAGPSLDKNKHLLTELKGKAAIFSVGTALKPLLSAGVRPDFVVSLDSSEVTLAQYKGLTSEDVKDIWLLSELSVPPQIIDLFYPRVVFFHACRNMFLDYFLGKEKSDDVFLMTGGSVSNAILRILESAEARKVIFVGLDLCTASDGRSHAKGSMHEDNRLPIEQRELGFHAVKGNYEKEVITPKNFYVFIRWIENFIRNHPQVEFINAVAGGAYINGTDVIPLEAVVESFRSLAPAYPVRDLIAGLEASVKPKIPRHIRQQIKQVLRELQYLQKMFIQGAKLSKEIVSVIKGDKMFRALRDEKKFQKKTQDFFMKLHATPTFRLFDDVVKIDFYGMRMAIQTNRIQEKGYSEALLRMPGMFTKLQESGKVFQGYFRQLLKK